MTWQSANFEIDSSKATPPAKPINPATAVIKIASCKISSD